MKIKKIKKHDSRTALRFPHEQREEIDRLVSEGKFQSLSELVREALSEFLKKQV